MQPRSSLSFTLIAVLPLGALGALALSCSSDHAATRGQLITCTTDPSSGTVLRCEPGGDGSGASTCQDIDEDGDGDPHDEADDDRGHSSGSGVDSSDNDDHDGDGIPDDH